MKDIFIEGRGVRLHAVDWGGSGPPALLLHGMGAHTHWWDRVAPILNAEYHVVALDFRGHGDSAWSEPPRYQVDDYVSDIEAARRHFGWKRFTLIAHSMGARAGLRYASRHGRKLDRLTVLDFLAAIDSKRFEKFERKMKRRQPTYSSPEPMVSRFHLQPKGTNLSRAELELVAHQGIRRLKSGRWSWKFDWRAFFFEYPPIWDEVEGLAVPCLVIRGEHSSVMPEGPYRRTLKAMKMAAGAVIEGAHHHVPLDAPSEVAKILVEFGRKNFATMKR